MRGKKTDWLARNETPEVEPRPGLFARTILRLRGEAEQDYRGGGEALLPDLRVKYRNTLVEIIPRQLFLDLIGAYHFRNAPLTGTLVIAHLLERYDRVSVSGFDNLAETPETLQHYFSEGNVIGDWTTFHEPGKEAIYLSDLIRQGSVIML